ncbi:MAG: NAD(P)-dependent oxidoreductase [Eubacteriaceae bacterium]
MKVAVFGAGGLFGEEIADVFEDSGFEVVRFKHRTDGDVSNLADIESKVVAIKPDLIINATGYRNPDDCKRNRDIALKVNTLGTKNLAFCAARYEADFMQISSDSVFSGDTKWPYSEFDVPDAKTVYGFTKIRAEEAIRTTTNRHFIIRVPMLFGFKGPQKENLMFDVWDKARSGTYVYGATDQIANPTYTKDAAQALVVIAKSKYYGTYHVSNEGMGSRADILSEMCLQKGLSTDHIILNHSEVKFDLRSSYTVFNPIAFRTTFNIRLDDWKIALKRCIDDYEMFSKVGEV